MPEAVPPLEVPPMPGEREPVVEIKKSEPKPLRLKPEVLPHFGEGDELSLCECEDTLDSDDDLEWTPSLQDKLIKGAIRRNIPSPKNRCCEVCRRAKMTQREHRGKKGADKEDEETPPLHFGHRLRADHITLGSDLTKGSCFIVMMITAGVLKPLR